MSASSVKIARWIIGMRVAVAVLILFSMIALLRELPLWEITFPLFIAGLLLPNAAGWSLLIVGGEERAPLRKGKEARLEEARGIVRWSWFSVLVVSIFFCGLSSGMFATFSLTGFWFCIPAGIFGLAVAIFVVRAKTSGIPRWLTSDAY